jgi:hypothetical protein
MLGYRRHSCQEVMAGHSKTSKTSPASPARSGHRAHRVAAAVLSGVQQPAVPVIPRLALANLCTLPIQAPLPGSGGAPAIGAPQGRHLRQGRGSERPPRCIPKMSSHQPAQSGRHSILSPCEWPPALTTAQRRAPARGSLLSLDREGQRGCVAVCLRRPRAALGGQPRQVGMSPRTPAHEL